MYVHTTPNADGSDSESGRQADADEARAQARNLSAFCCVTELLPVTVEPREALPCPWSNRWEPQDATESLTELAALLLPAVAYVMGEDYDQLGEDDEVDCPCGERHPCECARRSA